MPFSTVLIPRLQRAFRDGRTRHSGANVHENTDFHEYSGYFPFQGFLGSALPFIQLCAKTTEGTKFYSGNFFTSSEFLDYFCVLTHLSYQFVLMLLCMLTTSRARGWDEVPQRSTNKSVKHCFLPFSLNPGFKPKESSPPSYLRCSKPPLLLELGLTITSCFSEELLAKMCPKLGH